MVIPDAKSNIGELQIFKFFYGCTFRCNIEGEMLPGTDSVQYYTGKEGGSNLVAFAHNSANLLYLAHAESIQGWLLCCCVFMCLVITQGLLFCLTVHIQYFP